MEVSYETVTLYEKNAEFLCATIGYIHRVSRSLVSKEKFISRNLFTVQISGLHHYIG
jgi:hypothetical protein